MIRFEWDLAKAKATAERFAIPLATTSLDEALVSLEGTLYVVTPERGYVYHVCKHGRAHALCGHFLGLHYIVMRPLSKPTVEPPSCIPCIARLP